MTWNKNGHWKKLTLTSLNAHATIILGDIMLINKKIIITIFLTILFIVLEFIFPRLTHASENEEISLSYRYNSTSNAVTIIATSEVGFKETKPTWSLSKDKLTYRKTYFSNESYYTKFVLSNGKSRDIKLNVTQIDNIGPSISTQYIYDDINDIVTIKLNSNEVMANTKPTWTLSEDRLTYTKKYYANQSYYTDVKDRHGNVTKVKLNVKQIKGPKITMQYEYNKNNNTVTAIMKSNKVLAGTKPTWTLSEDKLTYTKKFDKNQEYYTPVQDTYGNSVSVKISINQIRSALSNGIDVSLYQGIIDWAKVKKSGVEFAMIRAGYRGYGSAGTLVEDSMFSKNVLGATSNGIDIGIYFYTQAITEEEAKEEAKFVLNLLKKYNIKLKYPIAIDTELSPPGTGRADNLSVKRRTAIVKTFCEAINNSGYIPMIYANKYWLMYKLDMSQLSEYDVWLAHYTTTTDYTGKYTIWQYTDKGVINGIDGYVDKNYGYKKY